MNELFKKREVNFLIQLIALSILLFGIHSYLNYHFAKDVGVVKASARFILLMNNKELVNRLVKPELKTYKLH